MFFGLPLLVLGIKIYVFQIKKSLRIKIDLGTQFYLFQTIYNKL